MYSTKIYPIRSKLYIDGFYLPTQLSFNRIIYKKDFKINRVVNMQHKNLKKTKKLKTEIDFAEQNSIIREIYIENSRKTIDNNTSKRKKITRI
jgi:hypothetical protein